MPTMFGPTKKQIKNSAALYTVYQITDNGTVEIARDISLRKFMELAKTLPETNSYNYSRDVDRNH